MNDLQKELQELKAKVVQLELRIVAESVNWQPKGGNFFIQSSGKVSEVVGGSDTPHKEFGVERPVRQQAERAAVEMRRFNRLLALRDELCGDEVVNCGNNATGFYLYFSYYQNRWGWSSDERCESIQPYFTSDELVQKACNMLNSGEVEL